MLRVSSWRRICRTVLPWINIPAVKVLILLLLEQFMKIYKITSCAFSSNSTSTWTNFFSSQGSRLVFQSKCLQLPFSLDNMERIKTILSFKLEWDLTNPDTLVSGTEMRRHHGCFSNNVTEAHITYKWLIHNKLLICRSVWKAKL